MSILVDNDISLAFISETWFSSATNSVTAHIKNYGFDMIHVFREKRGGGVGILWKKSIQKYIRFSSVKNNFDTFQYQIIIFNGTIKTIFVCIYRFQETSKSVFFEELNALLLKIDPINPIILAGDFNFHFELSDLSEVRELTSITTTHGLSQFVFGPTHKKGHTLDLLFANNNYFQFDPINPIDYEISDHFPIFFNVHICPTVKPQMPKQIVFRDFKNVDMSDFSNSLSDALNTAFEVSSNNCSFQELYNVYNATVRQILNDVAPEATRTVYSLSAPRWLDGEYKLARAKRRRLEKKWKSSGAASDKLAYIEQREICVDMANDKRTIYYNEVISSKKGDMQALFKIANNIFDKNKGSHSLPQHDDAVNLANQFNNFYCDKIQQIRQKVPITSFCRKKYFSLFNGVPLIIFRPTTVEELSKILKTSGIKTSFHDTLPAHILKQVIESLLPYFCKIVNKSLSNGSVEGLKESIVNPLLKKAGADPEILKNYRPVSDLLFLSKLTERVVDKRLYEHMCINNLHCVYEHGYKKCHSTETLLLPLVNNTLLSLDSGLAVIWILIDLSAAFDTVDIDLALQILESEIGICGTALDWFESFLRGREQRVRVEKSLSDPIQVQCGVPQGSVLGPILFNIYIRSLFELIKDKGFNTSGYADDNNASQSFALQFQFDVITTQVPQLMASIKEWMNAHFLKLNQDKTEIICFLPPNCYRHDTICGTFFENDCIRFSNSVKNLGFTIDKHLKMDHHVDGIVSHCYKLLGDVRRNRHLLSDENVETVVHSIVGSRLDYCNSLFHGIDKKVMNKLQKLQNAAARIISKRKKRESVRDVLAKLHWLPVEKRIVYKILVLTFKIVHDLSPKNLRDLLSYRCQNTLTFNLSYFHSNFGRQSFSYAAPRYWNALPVDLRFLDNLDTFKRNIKTYLFNNFSVLKSKAFVYHQ